MRPYLLLVALVLASCQAPVTLYLAPEVEGLKTVVEAHRTAIEQRVGRSFAVVTGVPPLGTNAPRLVVSAWDAGQAPPTGEVPFALGPEAGYATAAVLTKTYRSPDGRWRQLPLFLDVPGVTEFSTVGGAASPLGWDHRPATPVVLAGSSELTRRQVWLGTPTAEAFQQWVARGHWAADTWRFQRADVVGRYRPASGTVFLEGFRDYFGANPPGFRIFHPLVSKDDFPRVVGRLVTLGAWGSPDLAPSAAAWGRLLASPEVQQDWGRTTGWMALSLGTPVLDPASAMVRDLLVRATAFAATSSVTSEDLDRVDAILGSPRTAQD